MVSVPPNALLKLFGSCRNYFGWYRSKVTIFNSYFSVATLSGFRRILIFLMSYSLTSPVTYLISGIGGDLICAWTYALSQGGEIFMVVYLRLCGIVGFFHVVTLLSTVRI